MRERVWADVTGDPTSTHYHIKPEDPDHVQQQLTALEHEIADISPKDAYEKALQINSQYVQDQALRLMFLRSEDFDAQDAAQRMVRHFDKKQELFGEDMLTKDIRLKDLTQDDLEALSCGGIQLLPQRDRAGRMIVFSRYLGFRYKSRTSMVSVGFVDQLFLMFDFLLVEWNSFLTPHISTAKSSMVSTHVNSCRKR
jgi:hypothetical protein